MTAKVIVAATTQSAILSLCERSLSWPCTAKQQWKTEISSIQRPDSSAVDLTNSNPQRNPHRHHGNDDGDGDGAHGAISLSGSLAWHGAAQPASDWYVAIDYSGTQESVLTEFVDLEPGGDSEESPNGDPEDALAEHPESDRQTAAELARADVHLERLLVVGS